MSILTRWLQSRRSTRGLSGVIAIIVVTVVGFQRDARLFLDDPGLDFYSLEHPRWQRIRAEHKNLYPHTTPRVRVRWTRSVISFKHAGTDRYIAQRNAETAQAGIFRSQNIRGRYHQWMNELPERVSLKHSILMRKKSSVI